MAPAAQIRPPRTPSDRRDPAASGRGSGGASISPAAAGVTAVPGDRASDVSEADTVVFRATRQRLFGIAYRVLRSPSDADDVVQETWIRWQGTDRTKVRDAAAFLATTTMRLAINVTQSAHARRETHIGRELVERVDPAADPLVDAERCDALESAVRTLVQKLSPAERAAYVLRESFDYPYRDISQVLAVSEANARQLVTRARRRLGEGPLRPGGTTEHQRLLDAFLAAAQAGDLATLERMLASGAINHATRGDVVPAAA